MAAGFGRSSGVVYVDGAEGAPHTTEYLEGWQLTECGEKFAIGQRCLLLETEAGNILWDLISFLDDSTIEFVCSPSAIIDREGS